MPITTCIFDAYGTLFDVAAAARSVASDTNHEAFADRWQTVAEDWRHKQLQYTWLRAITGHHVDFWQITQDSLDWALEAAGLDEHAALREDLLRLYWRLRAFPEVPDVLGALRAADMNIAILSNGSPEMLGAAVESAGIGDLLDDTLSVESVGIFKPAAVVYDLVGQRFGCAAGEVLFVSSNGWDAAAAASYGFETAWVNRKHEPTDRLPGKPSHRISNLSGVPELAAQL